MEDWYCFCVGLQDIRRIGTGSVVNWGLFLRTGTLSVVDCRIYRERVLGL